MMAKATTELLRIELLHQTSKFGREISRIKVLDVGNTTLAVQQGLPRNIGSIAHRRKHPQTGYHNSAF